MVVFILKVVLFFFSARTLRTREAREAVHLRLRIVSYNVFNFVLNEDKIIELARNCFYRISIYSHFIAKAKNHIFFIFVLL